MNTADSDRVTPESVSLARSAPSGALLEHLFSIARSMKLNKVLLGLAEMLC